MVKRFGAPMVITAIAISLSGCTHKSSDAGPATDDTPPAQNIAPWAANAGDVARFADEEPFGPTAVVSQDKAIVRKSPGSGDTVATLATGTDVVKLAAHAGEDLVCFDEPKPGGRHLMGWIAQSALTDPAPPPSTNPPPNPGDEDGGTAPPQPDPSQHHHHKRPHKGGGRRPQ